MIRKNKGQLILTSVIILLPAVVGLLLWNLLPESMPTHWGVDGQADGWSSKPVSVFLLPVLMLVTHWICVWVTARDPKNKNQTPKAMGMVLWILPVLSLVSSGIVYATALGMQIHMPVLMLIVLGGAFVLIGNYLPKCKINSTIGIKLPWTLASEENWNATHRLGGKVWVIGGLLMMVCGFLPGDWFVVSLLLIMAVTILVPTVYSYLFYKKQLARGGGVIKLPPVSKVGILTLVILVAGVVWLLFSGDIQLKYGETNFVVEADYWDDLTVEYAAIDSVEYRDEGVEASRTNGFGSLRLLMGTFENEEFGSFTRYTYAGCDACVLLRVGGRTLVLSGQTPEETAAIYEALLQRIQ